MGEAMSEELKTAPEVTIIGAGIVGICSALSLLEKGISVRIIDRNSPGSGASHGNAGIISPWSFIPQSMPGTWKNIPRWVLDPDGPVSFSSSYLSRTLPWAVQFIKNMTESDVRRISDAMEILTSGSVELYRHHLSGTRHEGLVADSFYVHAFRQPERANIDNLDYKIRREKGADIVRIDAGELSDLEPDLSKEFKAAVLIKGQARAISPGKIGEVLSRKAMRMGAEFVQEDVKDIRKSNDDIWKITTNNGAHKSAKVLVASGVWSAKLLKSLGYKLPLVAERGYHVQFTKASAQLHHSVMDVDRKVVGSSMSEGLRVAGTSEFAAIDAPPNKRRFESLKKHTKQMVPNLEFEETIEWMGHRPSFSDNLPVLGELPDHQGLYGAFGHSHYGLMMAPKTGKIIASMISGEHSNLDLSVFAADRFK